MPRLPLQRIGLPAGPVLALATYLLLPETYDTAAGELIDFTHAGRVSAAIGVWMAVWWISEAIDIAATALLPLALMPLFGAATVRQTAAPYANEMIFLFMGGFMLSLSMQRWGLHERIALGTLRLVGTSPLRIVGGFMLSTALLSMWLSNTATTVMMLPIAQSVVVMVLPATGAIAARPPVTPSAAVPGLAAHHPAAQGHNFATCLMLGIAYAASIGGLGTIIGSPPNLFLVSYVREVLGQEITFARWMAIGVPLTVIFLPLSWVLLTRFVFPIGSAGPGDGGAAIHQAYSRLGSMKRAERITAVVFGGAVFAWVFRALLVDLEIGGVRPLAGLTDPGIAMAAALLLFVLPSGRPGEFVMNWETARKLPWGILVLFGGGLSLAAAIEANGVGQFLGHQVSAWAGLPAPLVVLLVTLMVLLLTELTSNLATTAAFVPILAAVAPGLGLHPFLLIVPAALAASCAFMLPVATPPNAIVFGSGYITMAQMRRAGVWMNLLSVLILIVVVYLVIVPVLGL
jgi:solute carrier family 13 (sodium-dependent dicarboxylate transporter), member 2/3/5